MIAKTYAICLRYYPFSNTSRVVQWLTAQGDRTVTLVKGSQRARSGFWGQYDVFYTCELVFYVRMNFAIHIARECTPLNMRFALRSDWKACAAASYFCDALSRIIPPQASQANLFPFLSHALDSAAALGGTPELLFAFDLQLLQRLGLAPRFERCAHCDADLSGIAGPAHFSVARGGVLCNHCRPRGDSTMAPITSSVRLHLQNWQRMSWPPHQMLTPCSASERQEMEDLLGAFLSYHLDTPLRSRAVALDVLRRQLAVVPSA